MTTSIENLNASGGAGTTVSLDQLSRDRIVHAKFVSLHFANSLPDFGRRPSLPAHSVVVRRAIALYSRHLDKIIKSGDPDQMQREISALGRAARGDETKTAPAALLAVPPRPFAELQREAREGREDAIREPRPRPGAASQAIRAYIERREAKAK